MKELQKYYTDECIKCKNDVEELYELVGTIACADCWHQYWLDNNIGEQESWEMFKATTLSKHKESDNNKEITEVK